MKKNIDAWMEEINELQNDLEKMTILFRTAYFEEACFPNKDINISEIKSDTAKEWVENLKEKLAGTKVAEVLNAYVRNNVDKVQSLVNVASEVGDINDIEIQKIHDISNLVPGKTEDEEAFISLHYLAGILSTIYSFMKNESSAKARLKAVPMALRISFLVAGKMYEFMGYWKAHMSRRRTKQRSRTKITEGKLKDVTEILNANNWQDNTDIRRKIENKIGVGPERARHYIKMAQDERSK